MTAAAPSRGPRGGVDSVEALLLAYAGCLLGGDGHGAGLLRRRVDGRFHTAGCPIGAYLRPDDRLTNGSPCSDRCATIRATITRAEVWLKQQTSIFDSQEAV